MMAIQKPKFVELEQSASVPSSLAVPVQSLISTVVNSLEESLSDELMNLLWKPSQTPQTTRRSLEDDLIVDKVRQTFNVTSDIEIVEVDDENDFDIAAVQKELRQQAEVHAQLQNGSFWSSMWNITDIEDQDSSDGSFDASAPPAVHPAPHAESLQASTLSPNSHYMAETKETVAIDATESSIASVNRATASRDDGSSEVVHSWQSVPNLEANSHRLTSLVAFLRQWADSYCKKGIGVSATSIARGCRVTFLALEDAQLDIFVTEEPTSDDTSTIRVVNAIRTVEGAYAELREQLQFPIQSIRDALQQELQQLDVPGMRPPAAIGVKSPAHDSDVSNKEAAAVVESATISSAGSAAFASIDEKDALFKEVWQTLHRRDAAPSDGASPRTTTATTERSASPFADPEVVVRARDVGVDVAEYNTPDLQSEAVKQLDVILRRTREQGMYRVLQEYHDQEPPSTAAVDRVSTDAKRTAANATAADVSSAASDPTTTLRSDEWSTLFTLGKEISELNLQKLLDRPSANPFFESAEELQRPPPQFPVEIDDVASWQSGEKIDIFAGPQGLYQNTADPRLPSMRERYDAARQRGGASADTANGMDDDAALLDYAGVSIDGEAVPSLGEGLKDEERALLLESLRMATRRDVSATGSNGGVDQSLPEEASMATAATAAAHRWMEQQYLRVDDRAAFDAEKPRFDMLVAELSRAPVEVHEFILDGFRDVLLSEHCLLFLKLALADEQRRLRESQRTTADTAAQQDQTSARAGATREDRSMIFTSIANKAAQLHTELMALIEEESLRHYQTIAEICEISALFQKADPLQFLDRLDVVKPKFDTDLLAFLNHHLFHDDQRLRRHDEALQALAYRPRTDIDAVKQRQADLLPESEEKRLRRWVQVLRILQQGVTAELERRNELSIEMLTVLLRVFDPRIRRPLFERYVNMTATTDLQALRTLAVNMVERLLDAPTMRQDADIQRFWQSASMGGRTPAQWRLMLECLRREVDEFLSEAVIEERLRKYNEQLAEQGLTLGLRHRNPVTQAAIESADRLDQRQIAPRSQMTPDRWLPGQPGAPPRPSGSGHFTTSHDFPTI